MKNIKTPYIDEHTRIMLKAMALRSPPSYDYGSLLISWLVIIFVLSVSFLIISIGVRILIW